MKCFDSLTGVKTHIPQFLGAGDRRSCRLAISICLRAGLIDPVDTPIVPLPPVAPPISSLQPSLDVALDGSPRTDPQSGLVTLPLIIGAHSGDGLPCFRGGERGNVRGRRQS